MRKMNKNKKSEWIAEADASTNFDHIGKDDHMDARERAMMANSFSDGMTLLSL